MLLMSMKSQVLRVIFRTPGQVDVEPSSIADSLRECAAAIPRAHQAAVDAAVDDADSEVVEIFSLGCPGSHASHRCSRNIFLQVVLSSPCNSRCFM
jgi:hypothetical protein